MHEITKQFSLNTIIGPYIKYNYLFYFFVIPCVLQYLLTNIKSTMVKSATPVYKMLLCDSETWAMKVEDMNKLKWAERIKTRNKMCYINSRNRKWSGKSASWLDIDPVSILVTCGRLKWLVMLNVKNKEDWISACRSMIVEGTKSWGRGRKTWMEGLVSDMKSYGLKKQDA